MMLTQHTDTDIRAATPHQQTFLIEPPSTFSNSGQASTDQMVKMSRMIIIVGDGDNNDHDVTVQGDRGLGVFLAGHPGTLAWEWVSSPA